MTNMREPPRSMRQNGLEPSTSPLSGVCSSQLSYWRRVGEYSQCHVLRRRSPMITNDHQGSQKATSPTFARLVPRSPTVFGTPSSASVPFPSIRPRMKFPFPTLQPFPTHPSHHAQPRPECLRSLIASNARLCQSHRAAPSVRPHSWGVRSIGGPCWRGMREDHAYSKNPPRPVSAGTRLGLASAHAFAQRGTSFDHRHSHDRIPLTDCKCVDSFPLPLF